MYFACQLSKNIEGSVTALNRLGVIYFNKGNFKKSRRMHKIHLKADSESFEAYYNLGIVSRALKTYKSSK